MRNLAARVLMLVVTAYALSACAVGNTYDYRTTAPSLSASAARSLTVGVLDQRPYVLSGNKAPSFVGLQRGGYGNPWNVSTVSGAPLGDDFANMVANAYKAKPTSLPVRTPANKALDLLRAGDSERVLLISVYEWKTDTFVNVALHYHLNAKVYDRSGQLLGENSITGRDNLGPVVLPSEVGPLAAAAAKRKFEELLNAPTVKQSLQ